VCVYVSMYICMCGYVCIDTAFNWFEQNYAFYATLLYFGCGNN